MVDLRTGGFDRDQSVARGSRRELAQRLAGAAALLPVLAGLAWPAVAAAKTTTTAPQPTVYDRVILEGPKVDVNVKSFPRGNLVFFKIYNSTSSPQSFAINFQPNIRPSTSGLVGPGQIKTLSVEFDHRGVFPYYALNHAGAKGKVAGAVKVT